MVRRLKSELNVELERHGRASRERELEPIEVAYTRRRAPGAPAASSEYTRAAPQTRPRRASSSTATEFVLKLLKKRLFSSPAAFATTLAKHRTSLLEATRQRAARVAAPERRHPRARC